MPVGKTSGVEDASVVERALTLVTMEVRVGPNCTSTSVPDRGEFDWFVLMRSHAITIRATTNSAPNIHVATGVADLGGEVVVGRHHVQAAPRGEGPDPVVRPSPTQSAL